jgi:hypothetical protein
MKEGDVGYTSAVQVLLYLSVNLLCTYVTFSSSDTALGISPWQMNYMWCDINVTVYSIQCVYK